MQTPEAGPVRVVNLSESDVQRVSAEIDARPEGRPEQVSPEVVREALVAVLPKPAPSQPAPAAPSVAPAASAVQARVDELLQMAVSQGIDAAHAAASADEPYVLDELHDALTGSLYEELRKRGQI